MVKTRLARLDLGLFAADRFLCSLFPVEVPWLSLAGAEASSGGPN
jgi:hypothetical protein